MEIEQLRRKAPALIRRAPRPDTLTGHDFNCPAPRATLAVSTPAASNLAPPLWK